MTFQLLDSKLNECKNANSGITKLSDNDFFKLNDARPQEGATKAVIGPGTGLG